MHLELITPEQTLFEGDVKQATLNTHTGHISILPEHMPLVSITKPGILKLLPTNSKEYQSKTFVFNQEYISISIGNGVMYTDGEKIKLVVQNGSTGNEKGKKELENELKHRQGILEKALESNNTEAISNAHINIETIKSHLTIAQHD